MGLPKAKAILIELTQDQDALELAEMIKEISEKYKHIISSMKVGLNKEEGELILKWTERNKKWI
jgi:uncharacterized FlaG/YvyC family protein